MRISNRERKTKGRKELWKKVLKTKERKRKKKSEIKQKIQNNVNVHRIVTEKKQKNVGKEECARAFWVAHVSELLSLVFFIF